MKIDIEFSSLDSEICICVKNGEKACSHISVYYSDTAKGYTVESVVLDTATCLHVFNLLHNMAVKCAGYMNDKKINMTDAYYMLLGMKSKL